jgi:c(7)-type cytochrome triheme protein
MITRFTLLVPVIIFATAQLCTAMDLKDITFQTKDAGKVIFSHKNHLSKKSRTSSNLSCKACHITPKYKLRGYTMADMEKGKSCGACHNGQRAFALAKCTQCHKVKEVTYSIKETGPLVFSHKSHLKTMQCGSCHSRIFKAGKNPRTTMAEMERGKSCGACHNGKGAFKLAECSRCHPVKEKSYKVPDAGDVLFSHKFHTGMYSCSECHPKIYIPGEGNKSASMAEMEGQKSCGACHDGKSAFTVKENCEKCHKMK